MKNAFLRPLTMYVLNVSLLSKNCIAIKKGSKFSLLLIVRADGADPSHPYGQPDRKISVFFADFLFTFRVSSKYFEIKGNLKISLI